MIRIKDIARKANVSTATVSYVLNNRGGVSEETRQKVLKVIEELDYRPHPIAKSLKVKRTNTFGVVVEDIAVFNAPPIIDGINRFTDAHGLNLILTNMSLEKRVGRHYESPESGRLAAKAIKDLIEKQVDGLIYIGVHPRDVTAMIPDIDKPIVFTYCYCTKPGIYSIHYDDEYGAYEATKYLLDRGHRRIGLISGPIDSIPAHDRFQGYMKALKERELPFHPAFVKIGDWEVESGYRLAKELLAMDCSPTALLAMNDVMAAGAMRACDELGRSVPEEVSLIGFDNREFGAYLKPALTTMDLPLSELGNRCARTLNALLNGQVPPLSPDDLAKPKCRLVERESVGRL